ncbi:hypothetical protein KCU85_g7657, partial [Aureobasidium melanogenum]
MQKPLHRFYAHRRVRERIPSRVISTYGHSQLKTGHPVRSAIHKQLNGRLVLRWVTTLDPAAVRFAFPFCSMDFERLF